VDAEFGGVEITGVEMSGFLAPYCQNGNARVDLSAPYCRAGRRWSGSIGKVMYGKPSL